MLYEDKKAYVLLNKNGKAEKRLVTVGVDDGKNVSILSGLQENDPVIVQGNYALKEGANLRIEGKK